MFDLSVLLMSTIVSSVLVNHVDKPDAAIQDKNLSAPGISDASQSNANSQERPRGSAKQTPHRIRKYALGLRSNDPIPDKMNLRNMPEEWLALGKRGRMVKRRKSLGLKWSDRIPTEWQHLSCNELTHIEQLRRRNPDMPIQKAVEEAKAAHCRTYKVAAPGEQEPVAALKEAFKSDNIAVPKVLGSKYTKEINQMRIAQSNAHVNRETSQPIWLKDATNGVRQAEIVPSGSTSKARLEIDLNILPQDDDEL